MVIDDPAGAIDCIIAKCDDTEELERHLVYYASAVAYLVCHLAKQFGQDESRIRELYRAWAQIAVEEFIEPPQPPVKSVIH